MSGTELCNDWRIPHADDTVELHFTTAPRGRGEVLGDGLCDLGTSLRRTSTMINRFCAGCACYNWAVVHAASNASTRGGV